jgi:YD repeat-containing protein
VTNIEDNQENDTVFAYTSTTTTVTNRLSEDTVYTVDANGRVTKITNPLSEETEFAWHADTWELTILLGPKIDLGGGNYSRHRVIYTYGSTAATQHELRKRQLYKLTGPNGSNTLLAEDEWTYNAQHDVLTHEDPLGHITTNTYKIVSGASIGLIETITNAESEVIATYQYELVNGIYRAEWYKNGVNKTWNYDYNQNTANSYGIPDKITAPGGALTYYKIDVRGRQYESTPPTGNTSKIIYDAVDRAIQMINPDGTSTHAVYDCCHLVAEVDENGHGSTYEHNEMGRLSKVTDANGDETTYGYNAEGWQTSVTDPRGNTTTFAHDELGRVTLITYPGGWTEG